MPTTPVNDLIMRDVSSAPYGTVCANAARFIEELVNFGTHVLKWVSDSSSGNGIAALPRILLLRHVLRALDATSVLVRQAAVETSKALLRIGLESCFGFLFMTKEEVERRALSYIVCDFKRELRKYKRFDPDDPTDEAVRKRIELQMQKIDFKFKRSESDRQSVQKIKSILEKPIYKPVSEEYDRIRSSGLSNPPWYSLYNGPKNVNSLADSVGMTSNYEVFYRLCSETIHGSDLMHNGVTVSPHGDAIGIPEIRLFTSVDSVVFLSTEIAIAAFKGADKNCNLSRKGDIARWYVHEVKTTAQNAARGIQW